MIESELKWLKEKAEQIDRQLEKKKQEIKSMKISRRDYFAGLIASAIITKHGVLGADLTMQDAVFIADALIKKLDEVKGGQ